MKPLVLAFAVVMPAALDAETAADLQKKFVGSWRLVSIEGLYQNVKGKPSGIITYDNTGHMSVQIVLGERPAFPDARAKASDKEKAAAFGTYVGYYGTYTLSPRTV